MRKSSNPQHSGVNSGCVETSLISRSIVEKLRAVVSYAESCKKRGTMESEGALLFQHDLLMFHGVIHIRVPCKHVMRVNRHDLPCCKHPHITKHRRTIDHVTISLCCPSPDGRVTMVH